MTACIARTLPKRGQTPFRYCGAGRPPGTTGPACGMAPTDLKRRACHDLAVKFAAILLAALLWAAAPADAAEVFGRSVLGAT